MTISRWKVMACTLSLSVGALAVCVGQSNSQLSKAEGKPAPQSAPVAASNPDKPTPPATAPDTLPPLQTIPIPNPLTLPTLPPVQEFELEFPKPSGAPMPTIVPVTNAKTEPLPMPQVVNPAPVVAPVRTPGELIPTDIDISDPPAKAVPTPTIRIAPADPVQVTNPPTPSTTTPSVIVEAEPTFPPVQNPKPPIGQPLPGTAAQPAQPMNKLKILVRMGVGSPRFEIRNATGEELLLKVYAEKIEMKGTPEGMKANPLAGVSAAGKVRFTGPGIEGTCDELAILSGSGEVMLKGNVHMKTKLKAKSWSEMTADKMIYQIGNSGLKTATTFSSPTNTPGPGGY